MILHNRFDRSIHSLAKATGLSNLTPVLLHESGNLVIHLAPYPIVARLAVFASEENEAARQLAIRELSTARHLHRQGVPVILPASLTDAGPYDIDGVWTTIWEYIPHTSLPALSPMDAVEHIHRLAAAMNRHPLPLPRLGVWERTSRSVERLSKQTDPRIQALLKRFRFVDEEMRSGANILVPSHGDAHAGNLLASPRGWLWTDFEDVSWMPEYWDLASFVANQALFHGLDEPVIRYMLSRTDVVTDRDKFRFALTARVLMSTLGNIDFATQGYGDMEFAAHQLSRADDFIQHIRSAL
ncbi:phosphotransferase [Paenibacillus sp. LHD-117]|uniref:phosphotransferase n=1 Tax=Paenibacillus sp. LHD-117 TaxID=3071412 RepID=UPI0027E09F8A|nr:phosphotransferase [Paenibacillus sp. LHD-117]MDQ6419665.1 phosphotransferase [Paenibacillus sp. LHD-117]